MKILNIDAFAEVQRAIRLKGVVHNIEEISVQDFINNMKVAEQLEKEGDQGPVSVSKSFEEAVVAVQKAIPTLQESDIRAFKVAAMTAVMQFIRGEIDPDVATSVEDEGGAEKKQS